MYKTDPHTPIIRRKRITHKLHRNSISAERIAKTSKVKKVYVDYNLQENITGMYKTDPRKKR